MAGSRNRGEWALRDRPGVVWLVLAVLVSLVHPFVPASTWLMVHLVLLGALTHSAMVWSTYFTTNLLHDDPAFDDRAVQSRRLVLLIVGTLAVLVGVPTAWWPLTVVGAAGVAAAVVWHVVQLVRRLRHVAPARFRTTVRYYVAAAACLPVGAAFGATLARGLSQQWHGRLLAAHIVVMAAGWLGLTMIGTLVTLWPTMLRTRMDDRHEALARQALPVLLAGLAIVVGGALADLQRVVATGIAMYLVGFAWWSRGLVAPALRRPPRQYSTLSVAAALCWYVVALVWLGMLAWTSPHLAQLGRAPGPVAAVVAVGFALQLVTGALAYLVPSVLGGGPSVVRAAQRPFDRAATLRVTLVNCGLLVWLLPVTSVAKVVVSGVVLLALVSFVPVMFAAVRASVRARRALDSGERPARASEAEMRPDMRSGPQLAVGLALMALLVALCGGPAPLGGTVDAADGVTPTGRTTTVHVTAQDMRFTPAVIKVPAGNRLDIVVTNADASQTHDLVLATGAATPRLAPGEQARLHVGVVGREVEGWCSVVGHRQMGMTLTIDAVGAPAADRRSTERPSRPMPGMHHESSVRPGPVVADPVVDPVLPPLDRSRVHHVTLRVQEVRTEVAAGVWQQRWTFGGRTPGPVLHGRVGDTFVVRLVNDGSIGHSIDFHAGMRAPDQVMRTIPPGESLTYRFVAERAGIWMYHCSTMPMSAHIAAGMHGAVVIEPRDLPPVDASYVLVQSEVYLGADTSRAHPSEVDASAVSAEEPDYVVFNGYANAYDERPIRARVGDRIRVWVLDAGPNRPSAFHVVGSQFSAQYLEGAWRLRPGSEGGSQVLGLLPAQGGFVDMTFDEPGHYPMVSHLMIDAERGAHGFIEVTG